MYSNIAGWTSANWADFEAAAFNAQSAAQLSTLSDKLVSLKSSTATSSAAVVKILNAISMSSSFSLYSHIDAIF